MATNEILQFAETDTGTNLLTQAEYLADSQRPIGNQPGVARSKLVNKALRQTSLIASAVAQYTASKQANDITDDETVANVAQYLEDAIEAQINSLLPETVPAGSVIYVGQSTAPTGYLKANGAAVSRTTYAALFSAVGTTFGAGDGSTTFNLPDLRGEFPRGWDDGRGIDSGRALGSAQVEAIKSHDITVRGPGFSGATTAPDTAALNNVGTTGFHASRNTTARVDVINIPVDGNPYARYVGGSETRPRNVALLACIKF